MNRTTLSLFGTAAALAAITGLAAVTAPGDPSDGTSATATRLPVERTTLLCPPPPSSDLADTTYTSFTPKGKSRGSAADPGSAELLPAGKGPDDAQGGAKGGKGTKPGKGGKPVPAPKKPGAPVTSTTSDPDAPALIGTADGAVAPGWTTQQTTVVSAGSGRGVLGTSCTTPDSEFWFPGASTARERRDYVHLTNPDDTAAVVDLEMHGKDGSLESPTGEGITIPPRSSVPVLLSTLTSERVADVTLHVVARAGRVGASVQAGDDKRGSDWLGASADAPPASGGGDAGSAVLPGIPPDATSVRLVAMATGPDDANLKVRLASPTGQITPAGHETLNVRSGMTTSADLGDVTKGEPGSLVLSPAQGDKAAPFVAALRVTRGKGSNQETAFIPATRPIDQRATVADNRAKGSVLSLVAPQEASKVKVISSAGSEGGTAVSKSYEVKAGRTLSVRPPVPSGAKGGYAVTVVRESGGPVYGSRTLELPQGGVPMFTVETLPDDRGTVAVPHAQEDLSLLNDDSGG